jgi:hypothetical protein
MVDSFLCYLSEVMALIIAVKPGLLNFDQQPMTVSDLLEHATKEDFLASLTENKMFQLSRSGLAELMKFWNKMKLPLFANQADQRHALRLNEQRNLFVHNRGIVTRHYRDRVEETPLQIGEAIVIDPEQLVADLKFLMRAVADIDQRATNHFGLAQPALQERKVKRLT